MLLCLSVSLSLHIRGLFPSYFNPEVLILRWHFENIITVVFAPPRTGKTTMLCALAKEASRQGLNCFSNVEDVKFSKYISSENIGKYDLGFSNKLTVLLIDEAGIDFDNRNFKHGLLSDKDILRFYKLHGHYRCSIIIFSQDYEDFDKKLRTLAQKYFILRRSFIPKLITARPIYKHLEIDQQTHQFVEGYYFDTFLSWKWCFLPRYWKYFDSFQAPQLPVYRTSQVTSAEEGS